MANIDGARTLVETQRGSHAPSERSIRSRGLMGSSALALVLIAALGSGAAMAAPINSTFSFGGTNQFWATAGNWSAGVPTAAKDLATIAATNTPNLNAGSFAIGKATFAGAGGVTGTGTLTLDNAGGGAAIVNTTATTNALGANVGVKLADDLTVTTAAGGAVTIAGTVSETGSQSLTTAGSGTLTLSKANTYTGGTDIGAGTTVKIANGAALGTGAVTNDGTLVATTSMTVANDFAIDPNATGTFAVATGKTATNTGGLTLGAGSTAAFGVAGQAGTVVLQNSSATIDPTAAVAVNFGTVDSTNLGPNAFGAPRKIAPDLTAV